MIGVILFIILALIFWELLLGLFIGLIAIIWAVFGELKKIIFSK